MRNIPYYTATLAAILLIVAMGIGSIPYKFGAVGLVVVGVWVYLFNLIRRNGGTTNF